MAKFNGKESKEFKRFIVGCGVGRVASCEFRIVDSEVDGGCRTRPDDEQVTPKLHPEFRTGAVDVSPPNCVEGE